MSSAQEPEYQEHREGQYRKAIEAFDEAIRLGGNDPYLLLSRSNAKTKSGLLQEAFRDYVKAIKLIEESKTSPSESDQEVISRHRDSTQFKQEYLTASLVYGVMQFNSGLYDEAVKAFSTVIALEGSLQESFSAYTSRAKAYVQLKKDKEAIQDFTKAIELKEDGAVLLHRGIAMERLEQHKEALQDFTKAISLGNRLPSTFFARGNVELGLGEYEKAIADFDTVISLQGDDLGALFNRAMAKAQLGLHEQAIDGFTKAIRLKDNDPEAFFYRAVAKIQLKLNKEAIDDFTLAIKFKKKDIHLALNGRGFAQYRLGNLEKAIADYSQAIRALQNHRHQNESFAEIYSNRGHARKDAKQHEAALIDYTQSIDLKRDCFEAWSGRGDIKRCSGHYKEALKDYNEAVKLTRGYAPAFLGRGLTYYALENQADAIRDFNEAIRLQGDSPFAFLGRGSALNKLAKHEEAIADYTQAIQLKSDFYEAFFCRGLAEYYLGQHDQAVQNFTKAIDLTKDHPNPEYFFNRGAAYAAQKEHDKAIQDYDKAITLKQQSGEPCCSVYFFNRANAKYNKKQDEEAVKDYDEAIRLRNGPWSASEAEVFFNRGCALSNLKKYKEALRDYKKAIRLRQDFAEVFVPFDEAEQGLKETVEKLQELADTEAKTKEDVEAETKEKSELSSRESTVPPKEKGIEAKASQEDLPLDEKQETKEAELLSRTGLFKAPTGKSKKRRSHKKSKDPKTTTELDLFKAALAEGKETGVSKEQLSQWANAYLSHPDTNWQETFHDFFELSISFLSRAPVDYFEKQPLFLRLLQIACQLDEFKPIAPVFKLIQEEILQPLSSNQSLEERRKALRPLFDRSKEKRQKMVSVLSYLSDRINRFFNSEMMQNAEKPDEKKFVYFCALFELIHYCNEIIKQRQFLTPDLKSIFDIAYQSVQLFKALQPLPCFQLCQTAADSSFQAILEDISDSAIYWERKGFSGLASELSLQFDSSIPRELREEFQNAYFMLPDRIMEFFKRLSQNIASDIYLGGGCVRNTLASHVTPTDFPVKSSDLDFVAMGEMERNIPFILEECTRCFGRAASIKVNQKFQVIQILANDLKVEICFVPHKPLPVYAEERDAPINALYIKLGENAATLCDYTRSGLEDIKRRQVQAIALDKNKNFQEHPEQILRLIRIAGELSFDIEPETAKAIQSNIQCLVSVRPARRLREFFKLFLRGYASRNFDRLRSFECFEWPDVSKNKSLSLLHFFVSDSSETHLKRLKELMPLVDQCARKEKLFMDWRANLSDPNWLLACFLWKDSIDEKDFDRKLEMDGYSRVALSLETKNQIKNIWLEWTNNPASRPFELKLRDHYNHMKLKR